MTRAVSSGIRTDQVAAGSSEGTREIPARGERAPARGENRSRHSHPRQLSDEDLLRRGGSEHTHASPGGEAASKRDTGTARHYWRRRRLHPPRRTAGCREW